VTVGELTCACLYVAGHQGWAWGVRSRIEPWARRIWGRRLGVEIIWEPATTFPIALWTWGLASRRHRRPDARLAAWCVALTFGGALAPVAVLALLLRTTGPSAHFAHVLYLATVPLMVFFVASQLTGRADAAAVPRERSDP
jgi:hypothetical protein